MDRIASGTLGAFLATFSAWLLSGVLCILAGYFYLAGSAGFESSHIASRTVRDVEQISSRINAASSALSSQGYLRCTSENRRRLRGFVFANPGISDVGIYGDRGVACTAMIGNLDTEAQDSEGYIPITGKLKIWRSRDLVEHDGIDSALAVSTGALIFFIEPFPISEEHNPNFLWEILYVGDASHTISGTEGLYDRFDSEEAGLPGIVSFECSNQYSICVLILMPWNRILAEHLPTLAVVFLITMLLGFCLSSLFKCLLRRSSKQSVRTISAYNKSAFHCVYQPIVDVENGRIAGCEVLARLEDRFGPMSPGEFIPVIAENSLMNGFTQMMFDKAYSGLRGLQWNDTKRFKFSFNVFPANLNEGMVDFFRSHPALTDSRFQICLEVTEDSSISDAQYCGIIEQFNRLGIEISVDDFGSGYGNMNRLQSTHLSYLKVDKSLISHLSPANVDGSLTSYIPMIADNAGLQIVAEGIETEENLAAVRSLKIKYGQGFYFSRPLPPSEFMDLVASGKHWGDSTGSGKVVDLTGVMMANRQK